MKIVEKQIKDLIEAEYNPRRLTETQYKQLKDSLLRFGVVDPVLVNTNEDRKNIIIGGHQRTKVWSDLGNDTIPCVELDLTLDKEKELNVRLNKNTGEFDTEMLVEFFEEGQLLDFGFDTEELEFFTDDLDGDGTAEEDDYQEPDEVQTNIVQGDLITFEKNGKELHRLLCGDSTKKEDVERLMNGKKADMVFTDPPYNTGMTTKKQGDSTWLSHMFDDAYTDEEWQNFMSGFCKSYDLAIKDDTFLFVCLDWRRSHELVPHLKKYWKFSNLIIWDKLVHGLGSDYKYTHEFIHVCKKGNPPLAKNKEGEKEYQDVWRIQRKMGRDEDHATKKPVELCQRAIKHASNNNDLVLDLFQGSGSTMITSHQLNRKCYGMELMPKYCQVITDRMKALDSDLVIKINGKEYE